MHDMLDDWNAFGNQVDQALVHDKKYGYFLQITDTHVSVLCSRNTHRAGTHMYTLAVG